MALYGDGRGLGTFLAVVTGLLALHLVASAGSFTLTEPRLSRIAITPASTLSMWWRHLWAGLFHTTPLHILFNLALFSLAFPFAIRGHTPLATFLTGYAIGPIVVLLLHLALVRPLAGAGIPYAVGAMHVPLVGFSVIAYSIAGMATMAIPSPALRLGTVVLVLAFEVTAGVLLRATGPFIFVYHLAGFSTGMVLRVVRP
ncbi:MAG TPA: hypothetical protein VM286_10185 [Candidatus Thermoplasmatota archaeon]|nr:hypothetical protein [Candidatus Thermoplasmatota archaeon]